MTSLLVIDDDAAIRAMFARTLRVLGDVEEANGGALALRRLSARKFDLILLDLHMPLVDGFSVLETLATKHGPNKDTPIFVVTADESQQARIRAFRRHAIFLLTKPVHLATLLSLAESALKKAASRASNASDRAVQADRASTPERAGHSDRASAPERAGHSDRASAPERGGQPDKPNRG